MPTVIIILWGVFHRNLSCQYVKLDELDREGVVRCKGVSLHVIFLQCISCSGRVGPNTYIWEGRKTMGRDMGVKRFEDL